MSSILKALRKLEEEKAALGEGGVDIARDILKRSTSSSNKSLFWPLTSAVLFVLLLGAAIFYAVVAFWSVSVPPSANRNSGSGPVVQSPVIPSTPKGDVVSVTDGVVTEEITVKTLSSPVVAPVAKEVLTPQVVVEKPVSPVATRANGLPFLKLTGIAYRENATQRIAIINDLPVMQGTAIEGAQVVEIFPDRVLLQWQGKRFEQKVE